MHPTRRNLMKAGIATLAAPILHNQLLHAAPRKLPLGLQLYSVRDQLPKDYAGTLKQLGELGYREVESAGYFGHSVAEVKQALAGANLKLVSAHYPHDALAKDIDSILDFHHQLGVGHIVCSSPGRAPSHTGPGITLEDWRWNAVEFNKFADKTVAAGMKFSYHNHVAEFHAIGGVLPYDELMRLTDPGKVTFEMDCGWVIVGGGSPVEFLEKYPARIVMLHVKDFNLDEKNANGEPKVEEMGLGSVDYRPIFAAAAKSGRIEHVFVEQEAFNVPWQQSLKIDADYMHKIEAVS